VSWLFAFYLYSFISENLKFIYFYSKKITFLILVWAFYNLKKPYTYTAARLDDTISIDDDNDGFEAVGNNQLVGQNTIPQPLATGHLASLYFAFRI